MKKETTDIINSLFMRCTELETCRESIMKALELLILCAKSKATVLTCGNGGSAADSEHITGELMKGFLLKRELTDSQKKLFGEESNIPGQLQQAIRAISLVSQSAIISAFANDVGADNIFAQQVFAYAQNENDVLIAMSTSGNSVNVLNAVKTANACKIKSIAVTGANGGKIKNFASVTVTLPENETYRIQEYTLMVYHALCAAVEFEMFG
ncbi:MAG: SIS domain-containing protein [Clostridia bacterium]|nr:SIS domain-containing protein [Clostridia bacterium]